MHEPITCNLIQYCILHSPLLFLSLRSSVFSFCLSHYYFNFILQSGYVEAFIIPKDARNILIEEVAEASNYLAVQDNHGRYLLNGDWYIQWSGDYEMAGTIAHYERSGNKDKMTARGPLTEPLHIMVSCFKCVLLLNSFV